MSSVHLWFVSSTPDRLWALTTFWLTDELSQPTPQCHLVTCDLLHPQLIGSGLSLPFDWQMSLANRHLQRHMYTYTHTSLDSKSTRAVLFLKTTVKCFGAVYIEPWVGTHMVLFSLLVVYIGGTISVYCLSPGGEVNTMVMWFVYGVHHKRMCWGDASHNCDSLNMTCIVDQLFQNLVCWCFWAQSTTKDYIRAEHKFHSIFMLFISQVIIPQVMFLSQDLYYVGTQHRNLYPAGWPILFCRPTQELALATANAGKNPERFWKKCRWVDRKGSNKQGRNSWQSA